MSPIFKTPLGYARIKEILLALKIEPHDHQLEGIAASLDREDVVATMATGSGKTGFYTFLMLTILAISREPALALGGIKFPANPAMLVVVPTRALQEDMKRAMNEFGLDAAILNKDSLAGNWNLWNECQETHTVILISPELLTSSDFTKKLLDAPAFRKRLCRFGVDEMHLVHSWSGFRDSFNQIGFMRVRLGSTTDSSPIPLIATTATLREGEIKQRIFETLAIDPVRHHFIRRSNRRREIKIVVREMQSAASAAGFRELEWVLSSQRNTVIFCKTIGLVTRIATHLFNVGVTKKLPDLDSRIRTFTAVNWASQNTKYLQTLNNNPHATITIATDVLSVGWDNRYIQDVIIYGEPDNIDDFVQKIGRAGRDRNEVSDPRAILYVSKNAKAAAVKSVEASLNRPSTSRTNKASGANEPPMDISIAKLILALCYPTEIDTQYGNQLDEPLCSCMRCQQHHTTSAATIPACNCSGCEPEDPSEYRLVVERARRTRAKRGQGISKDMEAAGMKRFASLRMEVFRDARKKDSLANIGFFSPQAFLPDTLAKAIIKNIYSLDTKERVDDVVKGTELEGYSQIVYDVCVEVRETFETIRAAAKAARAGNGGRTGQDDESEQDEDED